MPPNLTLELPRGKSRDFPLFVLDAGGNSYSAALNPTPFLVGDALTAAVWRGDDQATLVTPTATFSDLPTAAYTVRFLDADSTALAPGLYRLVVSVTRSTRTALVGDLRLKVTATPGTADAPLAFTTTEDLLEYAPWLEDLLSESDQTGFAEQQARATSRLIDALASLYRPATTGGLLTETSGWYGLGGGPGDYLRQQLVPLVPDDPIPADLPDRVTAAASFLDARVSTALLLRPVVREVCAAWAVASVCRRQVGREGKADWRALAEAMSADGNSLFRGRRWEVDLGNPQTGRASVVIDGGSSNLR